MKRISGVIWMFVVGIVICPVVPFVLAYMAAIGDYDER